MVNQVKVTITERNGVDLDFAEELELSAANVPFDNTGESIRSDDLRGVISELTKKKVSVPRITTSSLNGTLTLTDIDNTLQVITGTTTGFSVKLPDATTLFLGERYEVDNSSNEPIEVKDSSGVVLATLNTDDIALTTLRDNGTAIGEWVVIISASLAAGVQATKVSSTTTFSTNSSDDIVIPNFTATPSSGTYGVWFSANSNIQLTNKFAECVIFVDGVADESSRRIYKGIGSQFKASLQTLAIVSVNGNQAIDVRVNISANNFDIEGRSLLLIRLGAES